MRVVNLVLNEKNFNTIFFLTIYDLIITCMKFVLKEKH